MPGLNEHQFKGPSPTRMSGKYAPENAGPDRVKEIATLWARKITIIAYIYTWVHVVAGDELAKLGILLWDCNTCGM